MVKYRILYWFCQLWEKYKSNLGQSAFFNIIKAGQYKTFCNLLKIKKYLLQLYQALHPEDNRMTEEGLKNVTINHVFTNSIYNDLCFIAGDQLIIMVEAFMEVKRL